MHPPVARRALSPRTCVNRFRPLDGVALFLGAVLVLAAVGSPAAAAPANDNFSSRISLPATFTHSTGGTNVDGTLEGGEPDPFGSGGASVWWSWTAPSSGYVDIDTFGSAFDTVLYVCTGSTLGGLTLLKGDDDSEGNLQSRVTFFANSGATYQIAVHGFGGATGSINLSLNPGALPALEDNFADGRTLPPTAIVTTSGSNDRAGIEVNEPDSFGYGGASVWYYWTATVGGLYQINTFGSSFDTVLYVYTGNSLGSLTEIAANDDNGMNLWSRVDFPASAGTTYRIAVHGVNGANGNLSLQISDGSPPPANDDFADRAAMGGTLPENTTGNNVAATLEPPDEPDSLGIGGSSVWWSWTAPSTGFVEVSTAGSAFDTVLYAYTGTALNALTEVAANDDDPGSAGSTSLVNFFATGGTDYKFAVHGYFGQSGAINLDITAGTTPPANDDFANRAVLASQASVSDTGTNVAATLEASEPDPTGDAGASVWWSWTAPSSGWFAVDTFGSAVDTIVHVATGASLASLVTVGIDDDSAGTNQGRVIFQAAGGTDYKISVAGFAGVGGAINLNIAASAAPPANNDFSGSINLGFGSVSTTGTNVNAGIEVDEPDPLRDGGASVWWEWASPTNGWVTVDTLGSAIDTILYVFTGASVDALTLQALGDDAAGSSQSSATFMASAGTTYRIAVHGDHGQEGAISLAINPGSAPPVHDDFANRIPLGVTDFASVGSGNAGAGIEVGEPDPLDGGDASVWWSWSPATTGWFDIRTFNSSFDTLLYVFTGASLTNLTPVGVSDSALGTDQSRVILHATAGVEYQIAVNGDLGETGSIQLSILGASAPPANDNFADRTALAFALPASDTASNPGAGIEVGEPEIFSGGASLWWSWTAPSTGWVELNTLGSAFDTLLTVFTGSSLKTLTLVGLGDNAENTLQSSVTFFATSGVTYQISVDGYKGAVGSVNLAIDTGSAPPPNDDFATPESLGSSALLSMSGSNSGASLELGEPDPGNEGGASVWFEWAAPSSAWFRAESFGSSYDTVLHVFTGATFESLAPVASNDDAGGTTQSQVNFFAASGVTYRFALHGNDGDTGAYVFAIGTGTPAPANDNFANATPLAGFPVASGGDNTGATLEEPIEPRSIGGGASVWFEWTAPSTAYYQVDTIESPGIDTVLYVYTGTALEALTLVTANDDSAGNDSLVNFQGTAGTTYKIAVHGDVGATGPFVLNIVAGVAPPPNDDFANRTALPSLFTTSATGSNIGATLEPGEAAPLGEGGASVWWEWTAPADGWVRFDTAASHFDTVLYIWTGSTLPTLSLVAAADNVGGSDKALVNFFASSGVSYKIALHGSGGDSGPVGFDVLPGSPAPINDDVAAAQTLSGTSDTAIGSNVNATLEATEVDPLGIGGASVWWKWTAPANGYARIDTLGSDFDTVLYVYKDSIPLDKVDDALAANNDGDGTFQSVVNLDADSGKVYYIAVHGRTGATGNIVINVSPGVAPPANDDFDQEIKIASDGVFGSNTGNNVGASLEFHKMEPLPLDTGGKSVWFDWKKKDNDGMVQIHTFGSTFDTILYVFTGGNLDSLVPIGSSDAAAGTQQSRVNFFAEKDENYRVAVHGDMGAVGDITITVAAAVSPPANDDFTGRTALGLTNNTTVFGTNEAATREIDEFTSIPTANRSVWWSFTAPVTEPVRITTAGSNFDTVLFVYTGSTLSTLTEVAADDDTAAGFQSSLVLNTTIGQTYHVAVHGSSGDTGAINLKIQALTAYEQWLRDYPSLVGPDTLASADPDKDMLDNLTELIFGLNPTVDSNNPAIDPNAVNLPVLVETGTHLELYYTLSSFNMNRGGGLPIQVTGATTFDFISFIPVAPVHLGGDNYKVSAPFDANPFKYLTILATDPNPPPSP